MRRGIAAARSAHGRSLLSGSILGITAISAFLASTALAADITVAPGQSISGAIAGASSGDRVLVQAGTYLETVVLADGVQVRGGYDGTFTEGARNPATNVTTIDGTLSGPAVSADATVSNSASLDGFVITGGGGAPGAGILIDGGSPTISNNTIRDNAGSGSGGGIVVRNGSASLIDGNAFVDNTAEGSGGGVYSADATPTISNNSFTRCESGGFGGAVYVFRQAAVVDGNTFTDCVSNEGGGGAACYQFTRASATFSNNQVNNCSADFGGGVFAKDEALVTMSGNTFTGCTANRGGGAAAINYAGIDAVNNAFDSCTATIAGGGIYGYVAQVSVMGQDATASPSVARFVDCVAGDGTNGTGGGVSFEECDGSIDRVRFTRCDSDSMGGGIYAIHSEYVITESIAEYCTSEEGGGMAIRASVDARLRSSVIQNCNVFSCSGTGATAGGGLSLLAMSNRRVADVAGTIVSHTLVGAAVRCKRGGAGTGTGTPVFRCMAFHTDPSNPIPSEDVVQGARCDDALSGGSGNEEGIDPLYCSAMPSDYSLQNCSTSVNAACLNGLGDRVNRGAAPDGTDCTCSVFSLEQQSWGQIKARYR